MAIYPPSMSDTIKRGRGRPKTGRELARYFILSTVAREIEKRAKKRKLARVADLLESDYAP